MNKWGKGQILQNSMLCVEFCKVSLKEVGLPNNKVWTGENSNFVMEKLGRHYLNQVIKVKDKRFIKGYFGNTKQIIRTTKGDLYIAVM